VRAAVLIACLLLITACASKQVDPLLIPPEANVEADGTSGG
jgi:predicted small lipoprotein YifL